MRTVRTQFGAKVSSDGRPVVTLTIIGICVAVWLLQQASPQVTGDLAFVPYLGAAEPWRFLTSAFVHSPGNVLHILFNMYALWILGQYLEPMLGRVRFAILYLLSAFGGSVGYLLLASPPALPLTQAGINHSNWMVSMVGASGAVFGVFGALIVLNHHLGRSSRQLYILLAINVAIGFVPGIAWQAHVGGFITGAAMAAVITVTAPQNRRKLQLPALAAVMVLIAVMAVTKYAVTDVSMLRSIVGLGS